MSVTIRRWKKIQRKNNSCLNLDKVSRISLKMFHFLKRKTKSPCEAYAILLLLKMIFEEEMGFNEEGFKPLLDEFERLDKD